MSTLRKTALPLVFVLAAVLIVIGSDSGIWDPWEMDRAHVARQIAGRAKVLAVETDNELEKLVTAGWNDDVFVTSTGEAAPLQRPARGALGVAQQTLKKGEAELKAEVYHAVLVDGSLIQQDPEKSVGYLESYQDKSPGAAIFVLAATRDECPSLLDSLNQGLVRQAVSLLENSFRLLPPETDVDALAAKHGSAYPFLLGVQCVEKSEDGLAAAFSNLEFLKWTRVNYKGMVEPKSKKKTSPSTATWSAPPLDYWITAASYSIFGFSETSSRLGSLVFGLLLLAMFAWMVRGLWNGQVALLASLVLLACPLFLGQAKNMAGEMSYAFFLAAGVFAFATSVARGARVATLLAFLASAMLLFLSKGLFGMLVLTLIAVSYLLLAGDWRKKEAVLPVALLTALFGAAVALVLLPSEWTFFSHFKFMNHPFEGGPWAEMRTFDYFVRQIAFVALPWTLILPFAVIRLIPDSNRADTPEKRLGVLVFLWFCVPFAVHSALLPDFLHVVFPAAGAMALAVALMWVGEREEKKVNRFYAVVAAGIAAVLFSNLNKSPEHLFSFLTADPHFGGESGQAFPADFQLAGIGKALLALVALTIFGYYARGGSIYLTIVRFFRKKTAFWAGLWVASALLVVRLVAGLAERYIAAFNGGAASKIPFVTREFYDELFFFRPESVMLYMAIGVYASVALFAHTSLGKKAAGKLSMFSLLGRLLRSAYGLVARPLVGLSLAALLAVAALLDMALTFDFSPDFSARLASVPRFWLSLCLPIIPPATLAVSRFFARTAAAAPAAYIKAALAGAVLAVLSITSMMFRETDLGGQDIWALTLLSFAFLGAWALAALKGRAAAFHATGWLLLLAACLLLLVPLALRWPALEAVAFPGQAGQLLRYLFLGSRLTWLLFMAIICFVGMYFFPAASRLLRSLRPVDRTLQRMGPWNPARWPEQFERPAVFVALVLALGIGFGAAYAVHLLPSFARKVSQKHILNIYYEAEERTDLGDGIFKYQQTRSGDSEDRNFYTSQIPALTSQQDFSSVLLAAQDDFVRVQRSSSRPGANRVLVRGFAKDNDANSDGKRDFQADAGVVTAVAENSITDDSKQWQTDQWKGYGLFDWRGNQIEILGNTENTLTLALTPPIRMERDDTQRYIIDHPDAPNHKASAMTDKRHYVVLGQETFSSVNFTFRSKSDGLHIPVLDGSNENFLLAASYLREGETNHNRFAQATIDKATLDRLVQWSAAGGRKGAAEQFGLDEELARFGPLRGGFVNFEDKVKLLGYQLENTHMARNDKLRLRVFYECTGKISTSWKVFIHMDSVSASNRIHGDHWPLNLSNDPEKKSCVGCWRTNHWMPGDIIIDDLQTDVPLGSPSGVYHINTGFYTPGSDKRLKVKDFDKGKVRHDGSNRVRIGTFEVN